MFNKNKHIKLYTTTFKLDGLNKLLENNNNLGEYNIKSEYDEDFHYSESDDIVTASDNNKFLKDYLSCEVMTLLIFYIF